MELTNSELHRLVSRLPGDIRGLLTSHPGLVLGGGWVRDTLAAETPSDIDIFSPSYEAARKAADALVALRPGCRIFHTANAITVLTNGRMPVQFITRWTYTEPRAVLSSFDFTVCQVILWHADSIWSGECHDTFFRDLAAKKLVYTSPQRVEAVGGSLLRVHKFVRRGYVIKADSFADVLTRFYSGIQGSKLPIEQVILSLLREVDPLTVIDGIEAMDEHKDVLNAEDDPREAV